MLSPKAIAYMREWVKSGNEWRVTVPTLLVGLGLVEILNGREGRLNAASLTIVALADALVQANETLDLLYGATDSFLIGPGDKEEYDTARKNLKEFLG